MTQNYFKGCFQLISSSLDRVKFYVNLWPSRFLFLTNSVTFSRVSRRVYWVIKYWIPQYWDFLSCPALFFIRMLNYSLYKASSFFKVHVCGIVSVGNFFRNNLLFSSVDTTWSSKILDNTFTGIGTKMKASETVFRWY